jgi:hypothetical protein
MVEVRLAAEAATLFPSTETRFSSNSSPLAELSDNCFQGNEFRGLPCKNEILARLIAPAFDCFGARSAVENVIQFRRRKLTGIKLKPRFARQTFREKRSSTRIVMPARGTDDHARHHFVLQWVKLLFPPCPLTSIPHPKQPGRSGIADC